MLHVQPSKTTPYHPQNNGMVEWFNQALKAMLQKAESEEGKNREKLIPFLLSYHEVQQISTVFLLLSYCMGDRFKVQGPQDVILKETGKQVRKVLFRMFSQYRRSCAICLSSIACENISMVQKKHKDGMIGMLERDGSNYLHPLTSCWQWPYPVLRKTKWNCTCMTGRSVRGKFMFCKWHTSSQSSFFTQEVEIPCRLNLWRGSLSYFWRPWWRPGAALKKLLGKDSDVLSKLPKPT